MSDFSVHTSVQKLMQHSYVHGNLSGKHWEYHLENVCPSSASKKMHMFYLVNLNILQLILASDYTKLEQIGTDSM